MSFVRRRASGCCRCRGYRDWNSVWIYYSWTSELKHLGLSVSSTDGKEGEEKVDLHIQVCAVVSEDVWAHAEK